MKKRPYDCLCLNKSWIPVHIIDWQRAISLIYQEKAHSLDTSFISYSFEDWKKYSLLNAHDLYKVHGASYPLALPEIIVSVTFNRLPDRQVKYSRTNVMNRDNYRCAYCGNTFAAKELTVDHILPRALGGKTTWDNVVSACYKCNQLKGDKTLKQCGLTLLYKPKKPNWFSPIQNINFDIHPCKSWKHFLNRIDISSEINN